MAKQVNQQEFYANQIMRLEKDIEKNKKLIEFETKSSFKDDEVIRVLRRDNNRYLFRLNFYKSKIK
jgi:uncharacterized protein YqfB (UPF0267 family)